MFHLFNDWSARHGIACMWVFLHFIVQGSGKPPLIHKVMLSLQKPFPDGMKEETAFATSQGNTLPERGLFLLTQLWRYGTQCFSSYMSHSHLRITQGPQCYHMHFMWWNICGRLSVTSASSLLLQVAPVKASTAWHSSSFQQVGTLISCLHFLPN